MTSRKRRPDALDWMHERYFANDPEALAMLQEERVNCAVAAEIYRLRTKAGLSQRALARRGKTTASVICRLEAADYNGHSLSMLLRVSRALNCRIEVRFLPLRKKRSA